MKTVKKLEIYKILKTGVYCKTFDQLYKKLLVEFAYKIGLLGECRTSYLDIEKAFSCMRMTENVERTLKDILM